MTHDSILSDSDIHAIILSKQFLMKDIDSRPIYFYDAPELVSKYPESIKTQSLLLISIPAYKKFSADNPELNFYNQTDRKTNKTIKIQTDYPYTITPLVDTLLSQPENATDASLVGTLKDLGYHRSALLINDYVHDHSIDKPGSFLGINRYEKTIINQFKDKEIKEFLEQLPSILRLNDKKAVEDFSCDIMEKMQDFGDVAFGAVIKMICAKKLDDIRDRNEITKFNVNQVIEIMAHNINNFDYCNRSKREILIDEITGADELHMKKQHRVKA